MSGIGKGTPGPGRPKGSQNKHTTLLKDAILQAAQNAGGKKGVVGYLQEQARENPGPFMALLGKVLPVQVDGAVKHTVETEPMSREEWARAFGADLETTARPATRAH